MDTGLREKVVVITGAGGGIGRACAIEFAKEGARLVVSDLSETAARRVADEVAASGAMAVAVQTDVAAPESVAALFDRAVAAFGRVDVLVNGAGIFQAKAILDLTVDDWDRMLAVNLRGVFLCSQAAFRIMRRQRAGKIVSIASMAGQVGGIAAGANYAASKAAIACFTKSLAKQAGPEGINVNCVNPGPIETAMTADWSEEQKQRQIANTPLGRFGKPEEVARAIVFLASDAASFIHGAHLDINGGQYMD